MRKLLMIPLLFVLSISFGQGLPVTTITSITTGDVPAWNGNKWVNSNTIGTKQPNYGVIATGDGSFSLLGAYNLVECSVITANRVLTLPSPVSGNEIIIGNINTAAFVWSFGTTVKDMSGNTITNLINGITYHLMYDGTVWRIISSTSIGSQATLTAGVATVTIPGLTISSLATTGFFSAGGTISTTWQYKAVCTANTLTITAITNTGSTDTTDTSTITYSIK